MADPISSFRRSTGIIVEENMKHDVRVKLNFFNVFYFFFIFRTKIENFVIISESRANGDEITRERRRRRK